MKTFLYCLPIAALGGVFGHLLGHTDSAVLIGAGGAVAFLGYGVLLDYMGTRTRRLP